MRAQIRIALSSAGALLDLVVQEVVLEHCGLGDAGVLAVARGCPSLTRLHLASYTGGLSHHLLTPTEVSGGNRASPARRLLARPTAATRTERPSGASRRPLPRGPRVGSSWGHSPSLPQHGGTEARHLAPTLPDPCGSCWAPSTLNPYTLVPEPWLLEGSSWRQELAHAWLPCLPPAGSCGVGWGAGGVLTAAGAVQRRCGGCGA